jgi:hypothetical protein
MGCHSGPHFWQCLRKLDDPAKLFGVLPTDMIFVIEILQSARGIFSDHLHRTTRRAINPNICPGWRNFEIFNSLSIGSA